MILYFQGDLFRISNFKGTWELLSKAQSKKVKTRYEEEKRKQIAAADREVNLDNEYQIIQLFLQEKDRHQREKNLEEAKKITITEDTSLPRAKVVCEI